MIVLGGALGSDISNHDLEFRKPLKTLNPKPLNPSHLILNEILDGLNFAKPEALNPRPSTLNSQPKPRTLNPQPKTPTPTWLVVKIRVPFWVP